MADLAALAREMNTAGVRVFNGGLHPASTLALRGWHVRQVGDHTYRLRQPSA